MKTTPPNPPTGPSDSADVPPPAPMPTAKREVSFEYSPQFPQVLQQQHASLLVSTYQAGKLCVIGVREGKLTFAFHNFDRVMGVAVSPRRIAVGARRQIFSLYPAHEVAPRIEPAGSYDACWLARTSFVTGSIHGHDLAWGTDGLWVVNTLFSCLCTLHEDYNFVPRWRPPFIKELIDQDRCHLNGVALENGQPRFVTAIAESNEPAGWRPTKATSGVVIEVPSGQTVARGLAMPHSPRLYGGRLWVLDSGKGLLCVVDPATGKVEPVEGMPGYTRGLAFCGPFAFVGLSKIRETAVFGGLPIAEKRDQLRCGVGVVDLRTGKTVATLQFHSGVEEVFAVEVLPGSMNPRLCGPSLDEDEMKDIWIVPAPGAKVSGAGRPGPQSLIPSGKDVPPASDARSLMRSGVALHEQGRLVEALERLRQAAELDPAGAEIQNYLGNVHQDLGKMEAALDCYRHAVEVQPDDAHAYHNQGYVLGVLGRYEEAVAALQQALRVRPNYAEAHNNLGVILGEMGRFTDSVASLEAATRCQPDFADAHWNLALRRLLLGDFERGWREYEWRWKRKNFTSLKRDFRQPLWDGHPLDGRRIFLHAEQGMGDAIQFVRYAPLVAERGGRVIVGCQAELKRLFQTVPRVSLVLGSGEPMVPFEVHCPLLTLPGIFGTRLDTIPAPVPYLRADAMLTEPWRHRLAGDASALKIGLVWAGKPGHEHDRTRSVSLQHFALLAKVAGASFYSLQKGEAAQQTARPPSGLKLTDWTADLKDFADTAALIANLDLVIAVDTAVAHLAGAMGKPVWTLLPLVPDFRWLLERVDNPWYPTIRLFRQRQRGDWEEVVQRVCEALRQWQPPATVAAPARSATLADLNEGEREVQGRGTMVPAVDEGEMKDIWIAPALGTKAPYAGRAGPQDLLLPTRHSPGGAVPTASDSRSLMRMGVALHEQGRLVEALERLRQAAELNPASAEIQNHLGNLRQDLGEPDEALVCYSRAVQIQPDYVPAQQNLGAVLVCRGEPDEALRHFELAQKAQPQLMNRVLAATVLPVIYDSVEDVRHWRLRLVEQVGGLARDGVRIDTTRTLTPTSFFFAYQGENDRDLMRDLASVYQGVECCRPARGKRLKIGFLSSYFREHTIGTLNLGRIQHLSREKFEVVVISGTPPRDKTAEKFRAAADRFVALPRQVEAARQKIAELGLDILFFTDVGMDALAQTLCYSRMAPVQCATWGHPSTTGSPAMDYFISSELLELPEADEHYTEKLVRLPNLGTYYYRPQVTGPRRTREFFGLPPDRHIYLCPQTLFKFHPEFDPVLSGILNADPKGELVVIEGRTPNWMERLRRRWARTLPDAARHIRFLPTQPRSDFLQLLSLADVMLDPFPFGGGNTSYEAFAVGMPVITWPGRYLRGRITQALYRKMGLDVGIVGSAAEYVARAVQLGTDPAERQAASEQILAANSVLYEDMAEVRALEEFFFGVH